MVQDSRDSDGGTSDEGELIRRLSDGDTAAAGELLDRHLPALRGFVRLRMGHTLRAKESVSDVVQSVCREILSNVDRFEHPAPEAFRQWLYATTQRKLSHRVDYYDAQKREAARELTDGEARDRALAALYQSFCTPSRQLVTREEIERIEAAFDALPEDYREVILLSRVVGLSRRAVAEQMERSEDQVRGLLSRALARLAVTLDGA